MKSKIYRNPGLALLVFFLVEQPSDHTLRAETVGVCAAIAGYKTNTIATVRGIAAFVDGKLTLFDFTCGQSKQERQKDELGAPRSPLIVRVEVDPGMSRFVKASELSQFSLAQLNRSRDFFQTQVRGTLHCFTGPALEYPAPSTQGRTVQADDLTDIQCSLKDVTVLAFQKLR